LARTAAAMSGQEVSTRLAPRGRTSPDELVAVAVGHGGVSEGCRRELYTQKNRLTLPLACSRGGSDRK